MGLLVGRNTETARFEFGANWKRYQTLIDEPRIAKAKESLSEMLKAESLEGRTFLDIGSGSGLHSLAARLLGASVHSFDYDPISVECTHEAKRKFLGNDEKWVVEQGSVLDPEYLRTLGKFDIVYSWGVLHHTGDMRRAFGLLRDLVKPGGHLFISIYNDQGWRSRYWRVVKKMYNRDIFSRVIVLSLHAPYLFGLRFLVRFATGRRSLDRGMSIWYDMIDWLGGYPFEVAKPELIINTLSDCGFTLDVLKTCGGKMGCNEYVFTIK